MRLSKTSRQIHLFVCNNRRRPDDPLGAGCGDSGEHSYVAFNREVGRRGKWQDIWITKTACLGVCPKNGCAVVAATAKGTQLIEDVQPADVPALLGALLQ